MDSLGNNLVYCGKTKNPKLTNNTSYFMGFIASFTKGLMTNFHLTVDTPYDISMCHIMYGLNNNVNSVF